jgi:hypothetical protein
LAASQRVQSWLIASRIFVGMGKLFSDPRERDAMGYAALAVPELAGTVLAEETWTGSGRRKSLGPDTARFS